MTVAVSSPDTGAVTASPASLTFTTSDYSTAQTVTLTVVNDDDGADESVTVSNTSSGGGYDASGDVTATVDDDDQGLTLSKSSVTVTEGDTETYTVVLDAQPAGPVTVTIAKANGDDADLTVDRSTLTFTTGNWSSAHTVTVRAAEESGNDYTHGTATFTHTASGGGYATTAALTAEEADNDRVVGVPATLRVPEGATATYDVKLAEQPSANVTLTLAKSGDTDLTVDTDGTTDGDQNTLTFTNSNWSTAQTVTVAAAPDGDFANGAATIRHDAASSDADYDGIPIPEVRVVEVDDDAPPPVATPGLTLSSSSVTAPEGATATYTVVLATRPDAAVTVTLTRDAGGDPDLTVDTDPATPGAQSTLVFTPARWNIAQTVTVTAAPDADELDGTATFTHTASGGGYDDVSATLVAVEADDNRRLVLSTSRLTVPEGGVATYTVALAAQPGGDVTVTLARNPGGDPDLAVDTDPGTPGAQDTLVFTPADWRTARTVTVAAAADADGLDGTATFTHTAAGGGLRRDERDARRHGGGRRPRDRALGIAPDGAGGPDGDVHGGAGRAAGRPRDGDVDPGRRWGRGPRGGHRPGHGGRAGRARVHARGLQRRAHRHRHRGGGRRRPRRRGDVHPHRGGRRLDRRERDAGGHRGRRAGPGGGGHAAGADPGRGRRASHGGRVGRLPRREPGLRRALVARGRGRGVDRGCGGHADRAAGGRGADHGHGAQPHRRGAADIHRGGGGGAGREAGGQGRSGGDRPGDALRHGHGAGRASARASRARG